MTNIKNIDKLVKEELAEANKAHPLFHSPHEAYGVLLEELEELKTEVEACEAALKMVWHKVRMDIPFEEQAKIVKGHAMSAAQEAIQVAAMCQKAVDSDLWK